MAANSTELVAGEGVLKEAAGYVADARAELTKHSNEMDTKIDGLRGKWAGAGGQAFFTLKQAWVEKQAVIVGALDQFEASLHSTDKDNVATDDAQAASYAANTKGLDG